MADILKIIMREVLRDPHTKTTNFKKSIKYIYIVLDINYIRDVLRWIFKG